MSSHTWGLAESDLLDFTRVAPAGWPGAAEACRYPPVVAPAPAQLAVTPAPRPLGVLVALALLVLGRVCKL